ARRLRGLVVEDDKASVAAALDAVGARRQDEGARIVERNSDFAPDLGVDRLDIAAPRDLPRRKPLSAALKPRPPQRTRLGAFHQRQKIFLADAAQGARRIVGKCARKALREITQRIV